MLSLSLTTGYAFKALSCLGGGNCSTRQIADIAHCAQVPRPYLAKVMKLLVRAGLVTTKRGFKGGISLARPANEISLLDIVVAVEGEQWMGKCLLGLDDCRTLGKCPTLAVWTRIRTELQTELGKLTLAKFIKSRNALAATSSCANSAKSCRPSGRGDHHPAVKQPAKTIV